MIEENFNGATFRLVTENDMQPVSLNDPIENFRGEPDVLKNATLSNSAVEVLNQLVVDNVSMRGNKWASAFNTEAEIKEFDPIKYAQSIAKRNPERINAMIAALQVVQKELDNKKVLENIAA